MSDSDVIHLSKVHIPWRQACNPYELHRALWKLFPDRADDERSFLFRVERQEQGVGAEVLLQSEWQPIPQATASRVLGSKRLALDFQEGQRLRFRLRANPVKTIKDERKGTVDRNGKTYTRTSRVPLLREQEQQTWLVRKLEGTASLEALLIEQEMPLFFHKESRQGRAGHRGKVQPVRFDGILQVQDPIAFLALVQQGVGPAKAFGCGLLSLAAV